MTGKTDKIVRSIFYVLDCIFCAITICVLGIGYGLFLLVQYFEKKSHK